MLPGQGEAAVAMVEDRLFKTVHHVAGLAVLAESPLVRIAAVAIGAVGEGDLADLLAGRMALDAGQGGVLSPQRVTRSLMVEFRRFPGVSGNGRRGSLCPGRAGGDPRGSSCSWRSRRPATCRSAWQEAQAQACVRPTQREAGLFMVEDGLLERDSRGMAPGALISALPAMRIGMTGGTARILEQVALSLFFRQGVGRAHGRPRNRRSWRADRSGENRFRHGKTFSGPSRSI